jgi:hypothetical protein
MCSRTRVWRVGCYERLVSLTTGSRIVCIHQSDHKHGMSGSGRLSCLQDTVSNVGYQERCVAWLRFCDFVEIALIWEVLFTGEDGYEEELHDFLPEGAKCQYRDILYPMAWLIRQNASLERILVKSELRGGDTFGLHPLSI